MVTIVKSNKATNEIGQAAKNIAKEHANPSSRFFTLPLEVCKNIATFAVSDDVKNDLTDKQKENIAEKAFGFS